MLSQVCDLLRVEAQLFQVIERLLLPGSQKERSVGWKPTRKEFKSRRRTHAAVEIGGGHGEFVQIGQEGRAHGHSMPQTPPTMDICHGVNYMNNKMGRPSPSGPCEKE